MRSRPPTFVGCAPRADVSAVSTEFRYLSAERASIPIGCKARLDDVGVAVAFLATNAAKLITGETLYIDGGYHIID